MIRGPGSFFLIRLVSGISISIALMLANGCSSGDEDMKHAVPQQTGEQNDPPVVVEWHPAPVIRQPQLTFNPAIQPGAGTPAAGQWTQTQPANQATTYPATSVPQGWMLVPVPVTGYTGQYAGAPNAGVWQQPVPVWNTPAPPAQTYSPPQTVQQYPYGSAPQTVYMQRPWGETESKSNSGNNQVINTWPSYSQLPVLGAPGYSPAPAPAPVPVPAPGVGYYNPYQAPVLPGYVW